MRITGVKPARHRLTAVFLDEERVLIDTETFLLSGYREGDEVSSEEWDALCEKSQNNRAYEKALYLLEYRAHSRGELLQKIRREYPLDAALQAVQRVEALGLINDLDFATRLTEELTTQKGYGKARVKADLQRRGIDRDMIDEVLRALPADQTASCKGWMNKKYKTLPTDAKEQAKLLAGAVRRGFDYATARRALSECLEENGVEGEESLWQYE